MKHIAFALLALVSAPSTASTIASQPPTARLPSIICVVKMTRDDLQIPGVGTPKAGVETCYTIDSRHHRERGYVIMLTERGLLIGWKDALFAPECGYWTAIQDLKERLLDTFEFFRIRYDGWHVERCAGTAKAMPTP